jgi:hypothetical protein
MITYVNGLIGNQDTYSNTGPLQYSFDLSKIEKVYLIPKGLKFTQSDVKSLYTKLTGTSAIGSVGYSVAEQRGYPIGDFIGCENKSSEATTTTTGYGATTFAKEGKFVWEFEWKKGGFNYHKMLKTFQNAQEAFDLLIFDIEKNTIVGTTPYLTGSSATNYVLAGISLELILLPLPKINTGSNTTQHYIQFSLADSTELTRRMAVVELPQSQPLNAIKGYRNLEFVEHTNTTAGTYKARITTDGGAYDLATLYGTALAALTANFSAYNETTGTTPTVTVTYAAATGTINFALTVSVPSSGDIVTITPPTISQLSATIPGFASAPFTIITP